MKRRLIAYSTSLTYCIIMLYVWLRYASEIFGTHVNFQTQNYGIVISQVLVLGCALVAFALIDKSKERHKINADNHTTSSIALLRIIKQYGILLIISVILLLIMFSFREFIGNVVYLFTKASIYPPSSEETETRTFSQLLMTLTSVGIVTPVFEELFFRGLLIGKFNNVPAFFACGISLCSFLLMHNNIEQVVYIFPMALVCCMIYRKTMKIAFPIFIHIIINVFGIINTFVNKWVFPLDKAVEKQSIYIAGINSAGLFMIIALLIIVLLVVLKLFYSMADENHPDTKAKKSETAIYIIIGLVFIAALFLRFLMVYSPQEVIDSMEIPIQ